MPLSRFIEKLLTLQINSELCLMLILLRHLIQLILSPTNGWKDLAERDPDPEVLLRRGLYPLMGISAATEFLTLLYGSDESMLNVVSTSITDFGAYFLALFLARLVMEISLTKLCDEMPTSRRIYNFINMSVGLMILFRILDNCLPWSLMLFKFLPLYVMLVMSRALDYLNVRKTDDMRFIGLTAGLIVAVPLAIYYLIYLLIQ